MKIDIEKYQFRPYDSRFKKLFLTEKRKLAKIFGCQFLIEHFGSTSVNGLGGKGIIDIIISVARKDWNMSKTALTDYGYEFIESCGDKERFFFAKKYKYGGKVRRVHIHLTFHNSSRWHQAIKVRDILRTDSQIRAQYVKLKKRAMKLCKGDRVIYRQCKNPFLSKLANNI